MANITPQQVLDALNTYYSESELQTLAFTLNISFENLEGRNRSGRALSLVQHTQRHGSYDRLVQQIAAERPQVNWDIAAPMPGAASPYQPRVNPQPPAGNIYNFHGPVIGSAVGGGHVQAENIAGSDIIIGQPPQNRQEFQEQLAALEALLKQAIAEGDIPANEAETVQDDVQDAVKEAAKEEPSPKRLTSRLEYVQEVLDKAAGVTSAAGKVGSAVLKAAPIVAGLLKAASILF